MTVYCKHCGKQITDDSLYCQHCGGKQDVEASITRNDNDRKPLHDLIKFPFMSFSEKNKKYFFLYVIWILIHIIFWMYGKDSGKSSYGLHNVFFPFGNVGYYNSSFNLDFYDSTEFLVYVFLLPLIIYFYFKYCHKTLMNKIRGWINNNK